MCFNCVISLSILNKLLMFRSPSFFFGWGTHPRYVFHAAEAPRLQEVEILVILPEIAESVELVLHHIL